VTWGFIGAAVVTTVGSVYEGSQQDKIANKELGLAQDTQGKQDYYNQKLMDLMANPGSFLDNPLFQSSLNTGLKGVDRSMAAAGYLGSTNQSDALLQYGQSFASGQLLQQEQLLGNLSGASLNPAGALNAASGATSAAGGAMSNLAGMAAFGAGSGMFGGGGGGAGFTPLNDSSMAGSTSGWGAGADAIPLG
jgi:hypothetical protein